MTGDIYYLQFFGNMGDFRQPSINVYMTYSNRPTLTSSSNKEVFTKVWTNGQQGSNIDYFARHCEGYVCTYTYLYPHILAYMYIRHVFHLYVCMYVCAVTAGKQKDSHTSENRRSRGNLPVRIQSEYEGVQQVSG